MTSSVFREFFEGLERFDSNKNRHLQKLSVWVIVYHKGERVSNRTNCRSFYKARQKSCLLYTSPSPRDLSTSRMPSSA